MLSAPHRLRQFRDFQRVYKTGRSQRSDLFRVNSVANDLAQTRFGVVVPNKLIKKATDRNRKKRQVRAALRELLPRVQPGHDVVISGQPGLLEADYAHIVEDITTLLHSAQLL